ncbi:MULTISPECIES: hypothetical protein [Bacillus cereus group]|uniref:hypothetical protein n=1 Tax=Bacillus cereus group TaxID=86661 RepID=UPI001483646E|nr:MULTISPECIES: hypothetical protein [Bacillus cereus group]MDA1675087.1 hypothetical protein [Bacillus cereus group sp. TH152-1LC]
MLEKGDICYWGNKKYILIWDYGDGSCEIKEYDGMNINLVKKEELKIELHTQE